MQNSDMGAGARRFCFPLDIEFQRLNGPLLRGRRLKALHECPPEASCFRSWPALIALPINHAFRIQPLTQPPKIMKIRWAIRERFDGGDSRLRKVIYS